MQNKKHFFWKNECTFRKNVYLCSAFLNGIADILKKAHSLILTV